MIAALLVSVGSHYPRAYVELMRSSAKASDTPLNLVLQFTSRLGVQFRHEIQNLTFGTMHVKMDCGRGGRMFEWATF
jgi:hypothetical protein